MPRILCPLHASTKWPVRVYSPHTQLRRFHGGHTTRVTEHRPEWGLGRPDDRPGACGAVRARTCCRSGHQHVCASARDWALPVSPLQVSYLGGGGLTELFLKDPVHVVSRSDQTTRTHVAGPAERTARHPETSVLDRKLPRPPLCIVSLSGEKKGVSCTQQPPPLFKTPVDA